MLVVVFIMIVTLLVGCQASPKQQSVVSKNNSSEENLFETQAEDETMPSNINYRGNFSSTDGSVNFSININQTFNSGKMPVVEVAPMSITSEDMQRVAKTLLGDVVFYEREPSSNPQYSKSQYQKMINRLSPYANVDAMTTLVGAEQAEDSLVSIKNTISRITEAMESAPDENPHVLCDWTLKKERIYNDSEWDIRGRPLSEDNDWLVATCEKDGIGYTYMVIVRDQDDYKINRFILQLGGASVDTFTDRMIYWSKLCRTEEPTKHHITSVQNKVMTLLQKMELGDWKIADTQIETYGTVAEPEYMLRIHAVPVINGIPSIYGQKNAARAEDYSGAYVLTKASFLMSANGDLIEMRVDSPFSVKSVINENVARIPFSKIIERVEQHLSFSDAGNYGLSSDDMTIVKDYFGENILCKVNVSDAEYGLARIMIKDITDCYYYVPAVIFRGNVEYVGENTDSLYYAIEENSIVCINSVDGSIIS